MNAKTTVRASVDCDPQIAGAQQSGVVVRRITLNDFRCYTHARIETTAKAIVLTGANGAGKTNMLEAVSMLVPGRGLRGARLSDLSRRDSASIDAQSVQYPSTIWAVAGEIDTPSGLVRLGTGIETASPTKRVVHIDGAPVRAQSALGEYMAAQWLTPQMDRLFLDGATERRRFLDRLIFSVDPAHAGRVSAYTHAMRERARLLQQNINDDAWLAALEETMASRGVAVAAARLEIAHRLDRECAQAAGLFPRAHVAVRGTIEQWLETLPALAAEDRVRDLLRASRAYDRDHGGAGGADAHLAHRSDIVVHHGAKQMPADQCSTGEQKMLLIALVLAGAALAVADEGRAPVLLLDEVAAHLDEAHRRALFDAVDALGAQAWYTGTDANLFAPLQHIADFYNVNNATLNATR